MTEPPHLLKVTYFADFTCPFCYVTEAALHRLTNSHDLNLAPRAYELYPSPTALPDLANEAPAIEAVRPLAETAMQFARRAGA